MIARTAVLALGCLLSSGGAALAQTKAIQDKVDKKHQEQKKGQADKDRAGLEELLALALKHNPDIRVSEAKVAEAQAELHRARMLVLNRTVTLQAELKGKQAEVDYRKMQYERMLNLYKSSAIEQKILDETTARLQKAKADLARVQAEIDLLTGRHTGAGAVWLDAQESGRLAPERKIPGPAPKAPGAEERPAVPLRAELADKLRKALDTPFKLEGSGPVTGADVLKLMREHAKGVNIQSLVGEEADAKLDLREPVPLGAFFQWAEDQFKWRFVIREYGIVVVGAGAVPPGGMLLSTFWRNVPRAAP